MAGQNSPLHGPRINYADPASRQQALAYRLMQEGASTRPVNTPLEGLARALQGGVGGYFSNQADEQQKAKEAEKAALIAKALQLGQGTPAAPPPTLAGGEAAATRGMGAPQTGTPGDPRAMAALLSGNPETAQMGLQLGLQNMQYTQQRADQQADRQQQRGWQTQDMQSNQAFQKEMAAINQAFQSGQMNAQQAFAAKQAAEQRAFAAQQQTGQQTFTASENDKNRAVQTAQLAAGKIQPGYQPVAGGGVQPIPGSPAALEAEEVKKTKAEQVNATDRMIRSIDELVASPGREFGTGFSSMFNIVPGTAGADFKAQLETVKSQAFLPMVAQLKGMGALSDAEGKKLTAAIGALEPSMSEGAFLKSLQQIKSDLEGARARMVGTGGQSAPAPTPAAPGNLPPLPGGFTLVQ